jgi:hypothetical protein
MAVEGKVDGALDGARNGAVGGAVDDKQARVEQAREQAGRSRRPAIRMQRNNPPLRAPPAAYHPEAPPWLGRAAAGRQPMIDCLGVSKFAATANSRNRFFRF